MRGAALFAIAVALTACSLLVSTSDLDNGPADAAAPVSDSSSSGSSTSGSTSGDASPDTGSTTTTEGGAHCPSEQGPAMVDTGVFCIDSTEVTRRQYGALLAANAPTSLMGGGCAGAKFEPDDANDCAGNYATGSKLDYPITCIDQCAAQGFCQWAGKRLCTDDEWMAVCTNNNAQDWPYPGPFDESKCNGANKGNNGTIPVGSLSTCEGGIRGVFDMVGNVTELTGSCTAGGLCIRRGGSYDPSSYPKCDFNLSDDRIGFMEPFLGFRCCADRK